MKPETHITIYETVKKTVNQRAQGCKSWEKEDLIQEAYLDLVEKYMKKYDPKKAALQAYVKMKTGFIIKDKLSRGSLNNEAKLKRLERAKNRLLEQGKSANLENLKEESGMSERAISSTYETSRLPETDVPSEEDYGLEDKERLGEYLGLLRKSLNFDQYTALLLKYYYDYSLEEIGDKLGISFEQAKTFIRLARDRASKYALNQNQIS